MVSGNSLDSIMRIFILILFALGITLCIVSLPGILASDSANPLINAGEEKIATFDEDQGSGTDFEHVADGSSLMHAEHYRPPAYYPQRQKRFVASHTWVHIVPFALLAMLALVTTSFFSKRRQKTVAGGKHVQSGTLIILLGTSLIIGMTAGIAHAQTSIPVKDAVVAFLGETGKIYQKDMALTPDIKRVLKQKLYWEPKESSFKVYYSKASNGAVEAYAFVLSDTLMQCGGRHKYCIKVSSKGQVEGVKVLELSCYRSFAISNERFLDKFKVMNIENADKTRIDALTGATISSKLTVMVVRRALALFELLKGNMND